MLAVIASETGIAPRDLVPGLDDAGLELVFDEIAAYYVERHAAEREADLRADLRSRLKGIL